MIFELREYRIKTGMRTSWVKLMDEMIIPFQQKMGMTIIGSFTAIEDEDLYIWIRGFNSEEERKVLYDKVYGSEYWEKDVRNVMGDMLIKSEVKVTMMDSTPGSLLKY